MEILPAELTNLFIQVPLVAIFIWFVLKYSERIQDMLDKIATSNQTATDRLFDQMKIFIAEQRNEDREARAREREITQQFFAQITQQLIGMSEEQTDHFRKTDIAINNMYNKTGMTEWKQRTSAKEKEEK